MSLYGGITVPGKPDLANVRRLDLLPVPMIRHMQRVGIAIDIPYLAALSSELGREMIELEKEIANYIPPESLHLFVDKTTAIEEEEGAAQFNANSADQIRTLLFDLIKVGGTKDLKRTKGGLVSTGKKNLDMTRDSHPIVAVILQYKERAKLKSAFADALPRLAKYHPKGDCPLCEMRHLTPTMRLHSEFPTTRAATGRIASKSPNLQQVPTRTPLGAKIRAAFMASNPGTRLVSVDFSQMELRNLAHLSQSSAMIEVYQNDQDIHLATAMKTFRIVDPTKVDKILHRMPSKRCIAKGQIVLTNHGRIPIERVTTNDLVWDGVEWVSHDGVVSNGVMPVITHDGLTSTLDHVVWTEKGIMYAAEAKRTGTRLIITEFEGKPVRYTDSNREDIYRRQVPSPENEMQFVRSSIHCAVRQHSQWQYEDLQMSTRNKVPFAKRKALGGSLSRHCAALYQSRLRRLSQLRRTWNQELLSRRFALCNLYSTRLPASRLSQIGYRSQEQQWSLQRRESTSGSPFSQCPQQAYEQLVYSHLPRKENCSNRLVSSTEKRSSRFSTQSPSNLLQRAQGNALERHSETKDESTAYAEVFDIVNAGPRHRFTVGTFLVANTNFLIQNGGTGKGLLSQLVGDYAAAGIAIPDWLTETWCDDFILRWLDPVHGYDRVQDYLELHHYRARRYGFVWDSFGRIRYIPEMQSVHGWIRSQGTRQAQNLAITADNAAQTKLVMAECEDLFVDLANDGIQCWPLLTIHDQVIAEVEEDYAEAVGGRMAQIFSDVMIDKQTGENYWRVPIKGDCEITQRWKKEG